MIKTSKLNQNKLIKIIDELFVFGVHPQSQKTEIVIRPKLTFKELDKIAEKTRTIIRDLYGDCSKDFLKGVELFEAIAHTQIAETSTIKETDLQTMIERQEENPFGENAQESEEVATQETEEVDEQ